MCPTTGEECCKSETLFNAIDSALECDGIWHNCVSMGVDNTNSNVGEHNSLKSRILTKNPRCFIAGCSCHLAHLAAGRGGKAYTSTSGFDMEEHQVDFYYYFKKSSRRKGILSEYMDFNDLEWNNVVRCVRNRWLPLQLCCEKELKKFPALVSLFRSRTKDSNREDNGDEDADSGGKVNRFSRLKKAYEDPLTEVRISFFLLLPCYVLLHSICFAKVRPSST